MALRRVLADTSYASRLGRQARQDVRRFNYERMAEAFERAVAFATSKP